MKTSRYKTGVLDIISRTRTYNPEIGKYQSHQAIDDFEFLVRLSNGTMKIPQDAAHSQQVFPAHVPEEWIKEIEASFMEGPQVNSSDVQQSSLVSRILKLAGLK